MSQIISIEFEYRQTTYFALVRIKEKETGIEYHITVMNGPLERKLYGNHIFKEADGQLLIDPVKEPEIGQLRSAIGIALSRHYNKAVTY
jgi:hypothetical protein